MNSTEAPCLPNISNKYSILFPLGYGGSGHVYHAIHNPTNIFVAIKIINKDEMDKDRIENEIGIMKQIGHPNIASFFEFIENDTFYSIVLELAENESLANHITSRIYFTEIQAQTHFWKICKAVQYLHNDINVAHRDIKAENILFDKNYNIKLIDFGMSKACYDEVLKTRCGSPFYVAPEVILGNKNYTKKVDIWSLGILLYYMMTGNYPFYENNIKKLMTMIVENEVTFPPDMSPECQDLISQMLQKNPIYRITIDQVIEHKWLNGAQKSRAASLPALNIKNNGEEHKKIIMSLEKLGIASNSLSPDNVGSINNTNKAKANSASYQTDSISCSNKIIVSPVLNGKNGPNSLKCMKCQKCAHNGKNSSISEYPSHSQCAFEPNCNWEIFHQPDYNKGIPLPCCENDSCTNNSSSSFTISGKDKIYKYFNPNQNDCKYAAQNSRINILTDDNQIRIDECQNDANVSDSCELLYDKQDGDFMVAYRIMSRYLLNQKISEQQNMQKSGPTSISITAKRVMTNIPKLTMNKFQNVRRLSPSGLQINNFIPTQMYKASLRRASALKK
ncbi:hypothetical protein TRFO_04576 [Tritrichomonas foetus]|uniref:Protein kinase domain-containing protein n=1 Tax=Tritrichomonas foetus TaxID=1144522 RepID=A0A1J4KDH3_9EUKA|nr:hypothetical protein TRFO_04576 [Tritrichomonas foetus]|eukprot:OHT09487.1 hypothetical protein TRFO_04576 [Tritrichomonas foetus]